MILFSLSSLLLNECKLLALPYSLGNMKIKQMHYTVANILQFSAYQMDMLL